MALNENAKAWVAALRSGTIKQHRHYLGNATGARCCLGVACDLAAEAGVIEPGKVVGDRVWYYSDDPSGGWTSLPDAVMRWLGLETNRGTYGNLNLTDLTVLNDGGATFEEIADIIESEPKGLFSTGRAVW